jgi:hypothetical protein
LARRYLNSAAAKALFRAGRIEEGEALAALFTRAGDQAGSAAEMQCMWYETEAGAAHASRRQYGKVRGGWLLGGSCCCCWACMRACGC